VVVRTVREEQGRELTCLREYFKRKRGTLDWMV